MNERVAPPLERDRARADPPSEPGTPTVLPGDADQVVTVAGARGHAAARVKLDGVAGDYGDSERATQAPVLLQVVVSRAADGRAAASEVRGVERSPDTRAEVVDRMPVHRIERCLRAGTSAEEIVVVGIEGRPRREFERPGTDSFGRDHLGREG